MCYKRPVFCCTQTWVCVCCVVGPLDVSLQCVWLLEKGSSFLRFGAKHTRLFHQLASNTSHHDSAASHGVVFFFFFLFFSFPETYLVEFMGKQNIHF